MVEVPTLKIGKPRPREARQLSHILKLTVDKLDVTTTCPDSLSLGLSPFLPTALPAKWTMLTSYRVTPRLYFTLLPVGWHHASEI